MEFYELNRLYDENLGSLDLSKSIDSFLFILIPTVVSFGCGISLINIFIIYRTKITLSTSRQFFSSQSIFNFLFQLISSIIFITNYYEKYLINYYFANKKHFYLNMKIILNLIYNIILYCVIWMFTISTLDYCITSIIRYHLNSNFNRNYTSSFYRQQSLFNYQQKLLKKKIENMHYKKNMKAIRKHQQRDKLQQQKNLSTQNEFSPTGGIGIIGGDSIEKRFLSASSSDNSFFVNSQNVDDLFISVNIQNNNLAETNGSIYDYSNDYQRQNSKFKESDISEIVYIDDYERKNKKSNSRKSSQKVTNSIKNDANLKYKDVKNKNPEEDDYIEEYFCKPKKIQTSIISVVILSFLLAFPQIFAYDIRQTRISISPTEPPVNNIFIPNTDTNLYENVVFIPKDNSYDINNQDYILNNKIYKNNFKNKKTLDLRYSSNIAKAYAMSIKFDQDAASRSILDSMRKTHMKFFTSNGFSQLASKNYGWCNMIKNIDLKFSKKNNPTEFTTKSIFNDKTFSTTTQLPQVSIVNLTLYCIIKGDINSYLAYNTLYFWLEHTMTISVPISIIIVIFISLLFTCSKYSKLISQQFRIRQKRYKLSKLKFQNTLNYRYNCLCKQNQHTSNLEKPSKIENHTSLTTEPKVVQVRQNLNSVDVVTTNLNDFLKNDNSHYPNYHDNDIDLGLDENEFEETLFERKICEKQYQDQYLNKLFLVDLFLYMLMSFPYTLLRLVLDLFVKDQIKISLDFFILYKVALITFHLHIILKFFIMIIFNQKYRMSLALTLTIQNSACCRNINEQNDEHFLSYQYNNQFDYSFNKKKYGQFFKNSDESYSCCFKFNDKSIKTNKNNSFQSLDAYQNNYDWYGSCYDQGDDDIKYHSIEFNTNYHQYFCPADPDQDNGSNVLIKNMSLTNDNNMRHNEYF